MGRTKSNQPEVHRPANFRAKPPPGSAKVLVKVPTVSGNISKGPKYKSLLVGSGPGSTHNVTKGFQGMA